MARGAPGRLVFLRSRRFRAADRQADDELAAFTRPLAPRFDGPAVQLDEVLGERQADAQPRPRP
jgi:hypothetical protein